MIKHILSFILGIIVILIGSFWVIPHSLEAIDSNVSNIARNKKYFSNLYDYDIKLWMIANLIFIVFCAITVFILKLPNYKKKSTHIKKYRHTNQPKKAKKRRRK
ncbi:hypothetical protein [Bacillus cereus]|uniref:hypothetical protein n=1 Tax=Bacillus cereus TaxID=1396 RepID=UPI000BF479CA|nr:MULTISPECIES: hypothetical protein [Bacillus]MDJ1477343.1 hypothetical protein [Bacillus sp. LS15-K4]PFR50297.1 hypothetical protein COK35_09660 [Bacillus cereus]